VTPGIDTAGLRRVRDEIVADPAHFSMRDWVSESGCLCIGGRAALAAGFITLRSERNTETGRLYDLTEAGAACGEHPYDEARFRVALNLTPEEADRLFDVEKWPQPLYVDYAKARSPQARADIAVRRIDLFIRTRGRE